MGFGKDYPGRKDHRKPYNPRSSKSFDRSCRNHGGCPVCEGNRLHKHKRRAPADDPEGDEEIWWDMKYRSDHLLPGERSLMFFDEGEPS